MKITKQRLKQIIKEEIERENKENDNSAITALLVTQAILGFAEVAEEELSLQESEVELSAPIIIQSLLSLVSIFGLTTWGSWVLTSYLDRNERKRIKKITAELRDGIPEEFDPDRDWETRDNND